MADLKLNYAGKSYAVDLDSITSREFKQIKAHTGMAPLAFVNSFRDGAWAEPEVLDSLLWLFKSRAGEQCSIDDQDYGFFDVLAAFAASNTPDAAAEDEPGKADQAASIVTPPLSTTESASTSEPVAISG